jgi:hypothetical protein
MKRTFEFRQTMLWIGAAGLIGFGLVAVLGNGPSAVLAQTKEEAKKPASIPISPPPADFNDLSMEVAALRTLYLLKAAPDQTGDRPANFGSIKANAKDCAQARRQRQEADVSKNYRKVLTELRAAFIANQEDRINELSDQLEELTKEEQPTLDDAVEITDQARKNAPQCLRAFDANRVAGYIAAYGKDFPDPYFLMYKAARADRKGKKQSPEQWKETRAFVIKEVSWQVGGLDVKKQEKIGEQVANVLDRAYALSDDEIRKEFARPGVGLRGELAAIISPLGPTDIIKHVVEQDFAELLSNPRLLPAIAAREEYLKKATAVNSP